MLEVGPTRRSETWTLAGRTRRETPASPRLCLPDASPVSLSVSEGHCCLSKSYTTAYCTGNWVCSLAISVAMATEAAAPYIEKSAACDQSFAVCFLTPDLL